MKNVKKLLIQIVLLSAVLIQGCATMFDGTSQTIGVNSSPQGAEVLVNGFPVGITPTQIQVKRNSASLITVRKEGYKDQAVTMNTIMNSWVWGDILMGSLLSTTIDYASGAAYEYMPNQYQITLEPMDTNASMLEEYNKKEQVRRYVLMSFNRLSIDIAKGEGEYLDALHQLIKSDESSKLGINQAFKTLLTENYEPVMFSNTIIQHYVE